MLTFIATVIVLTVAVAVCRVVDGIRDAVTTIRTPKARRTYPMATYRVSS